jgi:hypothetical protein
MSLGGKKSSGPAAPNFSASQFWQGGELTGETYFDPVANAVLSKQYENPAQAETRQYAESRIADLLPALGQPGQGLTDYFQGVADDYANEQIAQFNRQYDPMLDQLREDTMNRFGTLQATPFLDQLTEFEQNVRQPALQSIGRQSGLMAQDLIDQQQSRALRELQALGLTLGDSEAAFLNSLAGSNTLSNMGNTFLQNQFANQAASSQNRGGGGFLSKVLNPFG